MTVAIRTWLWLGVYAAVWITSGATVLSLTN